MGVVFVTYHGKTPSVQRRLSAFTAQRGIVNLQWNRLEQGKLWLPRALRFVEKESERGLEPLLKAAESASSSGQMEATVTNRYK